MSVGETIEEFDPFQIYRACHPFFAVFPEQPGVGGEKGSRPPTISYVDVNSGVAFIDVKMPCVVSGGSAVLGTQAADVWLTGTAIKVSPANEDVLIWSTQRPSVYETLAREFGVRTAFLQSVGRAIATYVRRRPHLSLSVERLVDPEVGHAVQVCFEVHGTRSSEETTQVWDDLETILDGIVACQDDRNALIEKIGVHVHRGSV